MARLSLAALNALANDYDGGTRMLSPLSLAVLFGVLREAAEIFHWSELTDEEKEFARDIVNRAYRELTEERQVEGMPIGAMIPFLGGETPENYLPCDGSGLTYDPDEYPDLFAVLHQNYKFQWPSGQWYFVLPDMRFRVAIGYDSNTPGYPVGFSGGEAMHELTVNEIPTHNHGLVRPSGTGSTQWSVVQAGGAATATGTTNHAGGGLAHNNMQPFVVIGMYICRAK